MSQILGITRAAQVLDVNYVIGARGRIIIALAGTD
jgi:hypothetical protein